MMVAMVAPGCGSTATTPPGSTNETSLKPTPDGNFVLYVSDQSFKLPTVDITIRIDGKVAVSDDFAVGNEHNWIKYRFALGRGMHHLAAITHAGHARVEGRFRIDGKLNGVVNYWYSPGNPGGERKMTFDHTTHEIGFA